MLLGNKLAVGKATIHTKVTLEAVTSIETEKIGEENPGIFLCVLWPENKKERKISKGRRKFVERKPRRSICPKHFKIPT